MQDLKSVKWDKNMYTEFRELLYTLGESKYKEYNEKVIPNIGENIGIRIPMLRKIAKKLSQSTEIEKVYNFLEDENTYEEKIIQGMILPHLNYCSSKELFNNIDLYILRINNWALCDNFVVSLRNPVKTNKESFFLRIKKYIRSNNPWEIRFGIVLLNNYFVDQKYLDDIFLLMDYVKSKEHYVTMAIGWLISTCYFTNKELTLNYIKSEKIELNCINKALKKILESRKVSKEDKIIIKKLRDKYKK
ncbi:DNA alkylation repair protein [Haloimpatiens sp. FM7330]|uniref:DNA alkylation repair protein n=1 Tax=Haloimpatiens sp. FM7330 TaxID=3298610 RepID=UPI0036410955